MPDLEKMSTEAVDLLKLLIQTPSFSKEESDTAAILSSFFDRKDIPVRRSGNNIWVRSTYWDDSLPTILLNSHHDTVKPVAGWKRPPFKPTVVDNKLFGLGSNDAGGPLVSLIAAFLILNEHQELPYNLVMAATAEEEISGSNGVASILNKIGPVFAGIVGEPTSLKMAVAEKGLIVVDALTKGKAGHAARGNGENALYKAMQDINRLRALGFKKGSTLLGKTRLSITQIQAGTQHNVIPDACQWVIDVRTNEHYTNQEVFEIMQSAVDSRLTARSYRLGSSGIDLSHPLVEAGLTTGLKTFGSPTLSDQALMDFPTIKLGCGDSTRSHTPDEYIYLDNIRSGIATYVDLLQQVAIEFASINQQQATIHHVKTLG